MLMRILVLTIFKEGLGGGAGRVPFDMALALSKDNDVALICPGARTGILSKKKNLVIFTIKANIRKNVSLAIWSRRNLSLFTSFIDDFNPDVIHANDFVDIDFYGMMYSIKKGIPFFYTGHVLPSKALEFSVPKILVPASRVIEKTSLKAYLKKFLSLCDGIITLNNESYRDHHRICSKKKLYVIQNGKDLGIYGKTPIAAQSIRKTLIFIGFMSERKNQAYLIEAMRFLPGDYKLLLVGEELHSGYVSKLKKMCVKYNLPNVEFVGSVDYLKIPSLISKAGLFVSASRMEVQSLVVLEALASGRPVVGLRNETISELINGKNGTALKKNAGPESFAKAVASILEKDDSSYKKMCTEARKSVADFGWPVVEKKIMRMYEEGKKNYRMKDAGNIMEFYRRVNLYLSSALNSFFRIEAKTKKQIKKAKNSRYIRNIKNAFSDFVI